jgi:hypothetical protein
VRRGLDRDSHAGPDLDGIGSSGGGRLERGFLGGVVTLEPAIMIDAPAVRAAYDFVRFHIETISTGRTRFPDFAALVQQDAGGSEPQRDQEPLLPMCCSTKV